MKKTIPGSSDHALIEPSKRKYVLNVCLAVLVATALVGSFVVLFRHRQVSTSKTGQSSTASAISDSFSFSHIQTIAIVHETLYASDGFHYLYAIQMQSGTEKHYYFAQIASSLTVDHDILYMEVGKDANTYMQAWRLSDGAVSLLWSYPMACCTAGTFVIANGVVYIFAGGGIGSISALHANTGTLLWNYPTNGPFSASLTVANGILYAGMNASNGGGVYAFRANTGKLLWKAQQSSRMMSAPLVVNGIVYAASTDRSLYAIDGATGQVRWHYTTDYAILWQPVVSHGVIYVGTGNNSVFALRVKDGSLVWHQRMDKLSSYPLPNVPNRYFGVFVGAVDNNTVYVGSESSYMVALRVRDGSLVWHRQFAGLVVSPFAVKDAVIYVSSQDTYANQSAIYALRTNDGGQLWRTPIGLLQPTPAPTPTAESGDSGGIRLTKTGIPAFTVADVEQYFARHPTLTTAGKPGKIVKIEFITSKEASVLMRGESTGLPDDALVCYVELHGPFVLDVSVPRGAKLPSAPNVYYVFDAQTAKSLVFGTVG
jgi:outer membrane protein assembly factor BamB